MGNRIRDGLLHEPQPGVGRSTLVIGLVCGMIWLALSYVLPGQLTHKFLAAAVCFGLWGVGDVLPRRWLGASVVLRVAGWIFLIGLAAWIVSDFIVAITGSLLAVFYL